MYLTQLRSAVGIWQGHYSNTELPWLRWWDAQGNLLLTGAERAETELQRVNAETNRANAEFQRAEKLAAQLRALGIEPEV